MTSSKQSKQLGFAGLGAMGLGMVTNLLAKGFAVSGYDISSQALEKLDKVGGKPCISVLGAASNQERFFIMVATPVQADSVIFGPNCLVYALPKKAIICLCSTVPPLYIESLPARLHAAGRGDLLVLDCPVSGGFVGAANGTLSIMVGGDKAVIESVLPELQAVSASGRLFLTGDLGTASTLKMINQHLAGVHIAIAAETLAFAKSLGLSTRQAHKILMSGDGASWIMGDRGKTMLAADWAPKSAVDIFIKDLGIVVETADSFQLSCPIVATASELFLQRSAMGYGQDDDASIVCVYESITGKKVAENTASRETTACDIGHLEPSPLALVTGDRRLRQQLSTSSSTLVLSSADWSTLRQSFDQLAPGTLVGVDEPRLLSISPDYAHLIFFDYKVFDRADERLYVIFSNSHPAIQSSLKTAFDAKGIVRPVIGGSASDMTQVINFASLMHMAASAENLALSRITGIEPKLVYDLIHGAAGSSAQFNQMYLKMLSEDYSRTGNQWSLQEAEQTLRGIKMRMNTCKFPGRMCNAAYQMFKSASRQRPSASQSMAALTAAWA